LIGHVLVSRDEPAVWQGPQHNVDSSAALKQNSPVQNMPREQLSFQLLSVKDGRKLPEELPQYTAREYIGQFHAGACVFGRKAVNLAEFLVTDNKLMIGIKHREAMRHVVQRGVDCVIRPFQLGGFSKQQRICSL
jgi:hypothetical protein